MTFSRGSGKIPIAVQAADGGIAQLARAFGSYPKCPRFERLRLFPRPVGQVVKTPPFHGGNMGSSPVRVTKNKQLTEGGLLVFDNSRLPWDSKGAGVNGVPGARQSRAPARPQAGSPVRVTKANKSEPVLPGWRWVRILLFLRAFFPPSRKPGKAIE